MRLAARFDLRSALRLGVLALCWYLQCIKIRARCQKVTYMIPNGWGRDQVFRCFGRPCPVSGLAAGIGLGALVYNYDGKVFASDEGRMLAEMGDRTFELGSVTDSYRSLVFSDKLLDLVGSSLTQCAPECLDCVYEAHCGADPVFHHATQSDPVGIKPLSEFCARQKGIMNLLLEILEGSPQDAAILRRWGGM
jgi:hypothetical protein